MNTEEILNTKDQVQMDLGNAIKEFDKVYKAKKRNLMENEMVLKEMENFWNLLPKDFNGEIDKRSFINLFSKIYYLLFPKFNQEEIPIFAENEWDSCNKGKTTMDYKLFCKALFKVPHLWCIHTNKEEYLNFLRLILNRITKIVKYNAEGKENSYEASIKITIYNTIKGEDFEKSTWEICSPDEEEDELYDYQDTYENNQSVRKKRPMIEENLIPKSDIIIYSEDADFDSDSTKLDQLESCKRILLNDDEIIIYGYPTQYILTYFKNNIEELNNLLNSNTQTYTFRINNKSYDQTFQINFDNLEMILKVIFESKEIILRRDYFYIHQDQKLGRDFLDQDLSVLNNFQRNPIFDRNLHFQEILTHSNKMTFTNVDALIIQPQHKKALECVIIGDKIGVFSDLWKERIETKIETMLKMKFYILYRKIKHLVKNYSEVKTLIESYKEEDNNNNQLKESIIDPETNFFRYLSSTQGVIQDEWDSDKDIIDQANKKSPVILVIGPPKIGKTSVCKRLAEELNMVLLDPQEFFKGIFNKLKLYEEELASWEPPQEDPENPIPEDQKPKPPQINKYLSPLEIEVYNDLMEGREVKQETIYEIFKLIARSDLAYSRGLVIDQQSWQLEPSFAQNLLNGNFGSIIIDYVIELKMPQEELEYRLKSIKHNLITLDTITPRDIELIRKPKKKFKVEYEDDEADENEPQEEEEEKEEEEIKDEDLPDEIKEILPKPEDLLEITDLQQTFQDQLKFFKEELYPKFCEIINMLGKNYYHAVEVSGYDTDEIVDIIKSKLDFAYPPRPIAKILEGGELLMREGFVPQRRWSLWKQTDPVALIDDFKISQGSNEFAGEFCGRVFLFANEENRKKFLENPKKYLRKPPEVPKNYRIAIFGPPKSGKKLVANMLSELYKFKISNMEDIMAGVIDYQKKFDEPNLNNVYTAKIHFSQEEFKEMTVKKKTPEFYSKIIFWLDSLGIPLDKKKTKAEVMEERKYHSDKLHHLLNPPKPKEEIKDENELLDENMEGNENLQIIDNPEEERKESIGNENINQITANNDKQENKQTASNAQGTNLNTNAEQNIINEYIDPFPPEQEYEALNIELKSTQFYYAYDEDYKFPRPGGFILFNHPQTEEEFNKFTEFNITFDKVINLVDLSETPIKSLLLRTYPNLEGVDDEKLEPEMNKLKDHINKIEECIKIVKEKIGEDNVIDINCMDKPDILRLNLQFKLDPFYIRVDNKEDAAGENEDTILPLPKGEYGDFCPVTYKDDNWLFYGYKEFEVMVNSRKYIFAGEKERDKFSANPKYFLNPQMKPIDVIQTCPPHIFVTGYQGGGISSIVELLAKEFKMAKKELKKEFMIIWNNERLERKNIRIEKKRIEIEKARQEAAKENAGNPDINSDPNNPVNPDEWMNDEALNEEDPEFKSEENDKRIFRSLFNPMTPTIYDASWFDIDPKITTTFIDFMFESRRTPLVFCFIKTSLNNLYKRLINFEEIEKEYNSLLEKSKKKRQEEVDKFIKEKKESEENVEIDPEEIKRMLEEPDPDLPRLDEMKDKAKESTTNRFGENKNFLKEFRNAIKEKNIPVIKVKNDKKTEDSLKALIEKLNPFIRERRNLIEKQLVHSKLNYVQERKLKELESCDIYKLSLYKNYSPLCPEKLVRKTNYPVIYRDRIYYFSTEDEKQKFIAEPLNYRSGKEFPLDINNSKKIFIIGNLKSGKTTLSKILEDKGYLRVTLKQTLYDLYERQKKNPMLLHDCILKNNLEDIIKNGRDLDDELVVKLIMKRLEYKDCSGRDIVVDGFPFTLRQAELLHQNKLIPDYVFYCDCPDNINIQRAIKIGKFKSLPFILNERFNKYKVQIYDILQYYDSNQYNIRYLDMTKSNWANKDLIIDLLEKRKKYENEFSDNLSKNKPSFISNIITREHLNLCKNFLEKRTFYSPVSNKIKNEFCYNRYKNNNIIYFNKNYYFLNDEIEAEEFYKNLNYYYNYLEEIKMDFNPPKVLGLERIEYMIHDDGLIEYQKCCPVTIAHEKLMKNGKNDLDLGTLLNTIEYKSKYYIFETPSKMIKFMNNPGKYTKLQFPVKIIEKVPKEQSKVNFEITKTYLETNFGSIITKGLLELSKNRIKYPHQNTKETAIKYLALYLKANNPNNNEYSKIKYTNKLNEFLKNSKLPFDLLNVYDKYEKNKNNFLQKELIRKQLNNLGMEYDKLMEKAKIQKNTRFENFFKN